MKLGNIKVGIKMVWGFLIVAGFIAVVGLISLNGMNSMMKATDYIMDVSVKVTDAAMESEIALLKNRDEILNSLNFFQASNKKKIWLIGLRRFLVGRDAIGNFLFWQKIGDMKNGNIKSQLVMLLFGKTTRRDKVINMFQHAG